MPFDAQRRKANYNYYLSIGKCPRCGGRNRLEPGKKMCRECSQKASGRRREQLAYRRENGLCTRCGKPLDEGSRFVQCEDCRAYMHTFYRFNHRRYESLKEACRCVKCGDWAEPGKTMCRKCMDAYAQYIQSYGDTYREKKRQRRKERIAAGLCIDCGRPTDDGHTRCPRCREMRMDSTRKYRIIKRIEREAREARP